MASEASPAWLWGDTTVDSESIEKVRGMVMRRLDGDDRDQVLSMLFDAPHEAVPKTLSEMAEGHRLPEEARAAIRARLGRGMSDQAIADELGISRQAVTGVRTRGGHPTPTPTPKETPAMTTPTPPAPKPAPRTTEPKKPATRPDKPKRTTEAPKPARTAKRTAPTPAPASGRTAAQLREIREWAWGENYDLASHGRIPQRIIDAYDEAAALTSKTPAIAPDAAQPLAEGANDSEPQEDAGDPAIETEAPVDVPEAEDEAMGHPTGNDYTDKLDEARDRANAEQAYDGLVRQDWVDELVESDMRRKSESALSALDDETPTRELGEPVNESDHAEVTPDAAAEWANLEAKIPWTAVPLGVPVEHPEWGFLALREDYEKLYQVARELQDELNAANEKLEAATVDRDAAQRSMILALRQWADGRAQLDQQSTRHAYEQTMLRIQLEAALRGAETARKQDYALARLRRVTARSDRRNARRSR